MLRVDVCGFFLVFCFNLLLLGFFFGGGLVVVVFGVFCGCVCLFVVGFNCGMPAFLKQTKVTKRSFNVDAKR